MYTYTNQIASYLLAQSWQIAVLASIVGLISLALRNRSAHIRYLLWLIVLAKCLVPPYLTIPLAVLPERAFTEQSTDPVLSEMTVRDVVATETVDAMKVEKALGPRQSKQSVPNTREAIFVTWLVGVFLFLLWVCTRAVRYTLWLRRRRTPLPLAMHQSFQELFAGFKLKKLPRVWLINDIAQPFVWGLLRGSVYIPADFVDLDSPQRHRSILAHELSHTVRFDAGINVLQVLAQAIYWFHPFVWWINRKIRQEREKSCDEMAVAHLSEPPEHYTNAIVDALISERGSTRPVPSLAIVGSIKDIEERIRTMLRPGKKFYKRTSLVAATFVLLLALLTVPTALMLTARAGTETEAERGEKPTKSLHEAANDGDIHQIRLQLSTGAAVNAKDNKSRTALHNAANKGHTEIARLLIAGGADINAKTENGITPLHSAAVNGKTEMANLLILNGADVNAKNKYGLTPISRALLSDGGGRRMVELLVSRGAKISGLHLAAHRGNLDKVRNSLKEGINVDARDEAGHTSLYYAASAGHMHVVEFLISKGADVHARDKRGERGETPLYYAADAGWRNVAELLIAKGADVNARGSGGTTALESAAWRGRGDVAKLLIAKGADVMAKSDYDYVPLHAAASSGLVEVAELLIDKGTDINARAKCDETPLTEAADSGRLDLARLLIARGADVNAKCIFGCTPLHHAVKWGHKDVVGLLIAKGADVNIKTNNGQTPLNWAVRRHKDVVELLIDKGADLNSKDVNGQTPLHLSVRQSRRDMVELLITKGADVNARNKWNRTPLDIAVDQGHTEIVELLRKHGAKE